MYTHRLFGVPIDDLDNQELSSKLEEWVMTGNHIIFTPNAEMLLLARKNKWFAKILEQSDLSIPDAVSIRYAIAVLTDHKLNNRHTGVDTLQKIIDICDLNNRKIVLLGSVPRVVRKAIDKLESEHAHLNIQMVNPGKIEIDDRGEIHVVRSVIEEIEKLRPSVLAVALGHKKQEAFILKYIKKMEFVNIAIGVGGAIDMISGEKRRAPKLLRNTGFEWFWRLLIEPTRIGRIMQASLVFPFVVASQARADQRLWKGIKRVLPEIFSQIFTKK